MSVTQKAILPGVLISSLLIFTFSYFIARPDTVEAKSQPSAPLMVETPPPAAENNAACTLPKTYPQTVRRWCDLIEKHAAAHQLEPALVAAVMLQESGGNPKAISRSGAVGLMQVMPKDGIAATFMCINGPCFANRPSIKELLDPEFNIRYGVRMLAGLIERTGSTRDGLKSYGPMDVGYSYADKVLNIKANYVP